VHETSIQGRLDEMRAAARMFRDNPWVGLGYGGFESRFQEVTVREDLELRHADRSSHSYYLEVGAEQGLVGLACLSVLVALAVWVTLAGHRAALGSGDRRLAQAMLGFGLGGLVVLVGSVFLHDAHPHYFWLVVALVFAGGRVVRYPARQATGFPG
jgi:O-antigen ligase